MHGVKSQTFLCGIQADNLQMLWIILVEVIPEPGIHFLLELSVYVNGVCILVIEGNSSHYKLGEEVVHCHDDQINSVLGVGLMDRLDEYVRMISEAGCKGTKENGGYGVIC